MSSTVNWGQKPTRRSSSSSAELDSFVNSEKVKTSKEPMKRLNAEIPAGLHSRVKAGCALEGRDITEVLIELLEKRFPAQLTQMSK